MRCNCREHCPLMLQVLLLLVEKLRVCAAALPCPAAVCQLQAVAAAAPHHRQWLRQLCERSILLLPAEVDRRQVGG